MDDARYTELKALIESGFTQVLAAQQEHAKAIARIEGDVRQLSDRLYRVEGRIEEQSRIMAALIPTKVAAVGDKRSA